MSTVILGSAPTRPPAPPAEEARALTGMTWTGWDGSVWDLLSWGSGVFLATGIRGMSMPPIDRHVTESVVGTRWRGMTIGEREVFWPLCIFTRSSETEWLRLEREWWRTMRPDKVGTWTVRLPSGEQRSLPLRFSDDGDHSYRTDPARHGWQLYGLRLVAEEPMWRGSPIVRIWGDEAPVSFFGSGAPPFHVSSNRTMGSAVITNPGDVEAWPTWTLLGPWASADITMGDQTISVPFPGAAGETLVIDADPWGPSAMMGGVDRMGDVSQVGFAPIPAGADIPVGLDMAGTGSVRVEFTPAYYRAF